MGALKVWDGSAWQSVAKDGKPGSNTFVGPSTPPGTPNAGDLWYDTDEVSGLTMPITLANGGTGGTSAATARASLATPQTGNSTTTSGAPTTGTYARGDEWLDSNNVLWACTVAGTPGTWVPTIGYELAYNQVTANVGIGSTSQAAPTLLIEGTSRFYDGSPIIVEFSSLWLQAPNTANAGGFVNLWDASTDLGQMSETYNGSGGSVSIAAQAYGRRRIIPTPGTHNYRAMGWASAGTGAGIGAGTGAASQAPPAFIRVTRA